MIKWFKNQETAIEFAKELDLRYSSVTITGELGEYVSHLGGNLIKYKLVVTPLNKNSRYSRQNQKYSYGNSETSQKAKTSYKKRSYYNRWGNN